MRANDGIRYQAGRTTQIRAPAVTAPRKQDVVGTQCRQGETGYKKVHPAVILAQGKVFVLVVHIQAALQRSPCLVVADAQGIAVGTAIIGNRFEIGAAAEDQPVGNQVTDRNPVLRTD